MMLLLLPCLVLCYLNVIDVLQEYEFEGEGDDAEEDTEDLESNIKNLEFKLSHDLEKMQVSAP